MVIALVTFAAVFLFVISAGALLFYREAMMKRLASVVAPQAQQPNRLAQARAAGASLGAFVEPFERVLPRTSEETSVIRTRLTRAGYRKDSHLRYFYASKVLVPASLALLVTVTGLYEVSPFLVYVLSLGLGFLLPDFWLGNRIAARQLDIQLGLPEVLDFMVVCIEAGLSLDQAALRTADELQIGQPALSDELGLVNLEQRAGLRRADSWNNFAKRTDVSSVRALTALIIQVDQFGSSIAKALRVHSDTLRTQRRQEAEEKAAKMAVKLVFPLVFFIFPSIFVVVLGPAMITLLESFDKYLLHK
jgi:tight adherence protein C